MTAAVLNKATPSVGEYRATYCGSSSVLEYEHTATFDLQCLFQVRRNRLCLMDILPLHDLARILVRWNVESLPSL